ncbi:lysine--tRNA ligase [Mobiluncus porci]|uniref:Lysine--tRNA ligase n=1 Tax=Mobiluncus porci TaxID=2652278 RepID=A0A7K0K2R4_9ACTO|nr:lysine--tRNA ligase [Mobiluncus porci]
MAKNETENQNPTVETPNPEAIDDAPEQIRVRAEKRARLLGAGKTPYPVHVDITTTITKVREKYGELEAGEETEDEVGLAGRVRLMRSSGKLAFATLQEGNGNTIQIMISEREVGKDSLSAYKTDVDLGDHLFVHGRVISSKRGELSIFVDLWQLTCKALRPLPKTYTNEAGEEVTLSEDTRVRQRYLDMIMRPAAREMVRNRSKVVQTLRHYLDEEGYIEVETPMLQVLHGGAAARPFVTHMNAYDMDLYLRIAPELFLKRCLVGGIDKVFEINRNFRNEGADSSHSPEFTMMEAYCAYGDYHQIANLTQEMIQRCARDVYGSEVVTLNDGTEFNLGGEWKWMDLYGSLSEALGQQVDVNTPREALVKIAEAREIELEPYYVPGKIVETLWEELVGDKIWEPTFVCDFPEDTSPLVKTHPDKPGQVQKWDLIIRGFEVATGYSELNDPVIQRARFEAQSLEAANGDPEAMQVDEDFLAAMEQGMPPAGGMGMGLDRLLMTLTGLGIRETITFPLVKPISQ